MCTYYLAYLSSPTLIPTTQHTAFNFTSNTYWIAIPEGTEQHSKNAYPLTTQRGTYFQTSNLWHLPLTNHHIQLITSKYPEKYQVCASLYGSVQHSVSPAFRPRRLWSFQKIKMYDHKILPPYLFLSYHTSSSEDSSATRSASSSSSWRGLQG